MHEEIIPIPLKEIFADEDFNCRGSINSINAIDLAKSIHERGLMQPILVQPWDKIPGKKYRIVMGYRRFRAHQINKTMYQDAPDTIDAIIKSGLSEEDALVLNLAENIQRENLTIIQEARSIEKLKMHGWTENQVAEKITKSRGWVQIRFQLLELPDDIQQEAANGNLTQQQIRDVWTTMNHLGMEAAYEFVRKIKDSKIAGTKAPTDPSKLQANRRRNTKRVRTSEEMAEIQDLIRSKLGNNVTTRVLAWCMGEIDDLALHSSLKQYFLDNGKTYMIPLALTQPKHALLV